MSNKTNVAPRLKAASDEHVIDFYAAAFSDTPDKQGDLIDPKAFDEWLKVFYEAGKPLPISFAHEAVLADGQVQQMVEMIGYAPATKEHVWVDSYGLRVKAILFDEEKANQVYERTKAGLVASASFAYLIARGGERTLKSGARLITKIANVFEAGPCLDPANDDAYVVGVKVSGMFPGSVEAQNAAIGAAVEAWGEKTYPADDGGNQSAFVSVIGTFTDRVVAAVESPEEETSYMEFPYKVADDGAVSLADPSPVDVTISLSRAKATGFAELVVKPRVSGQASNDAPHEPPEEPEAKSQEPAGANDEEPMDTDAALARLRLTAADVL